MKIELNLSEDDQELFEMIALRKGMTAGEVISKFITDFSKAYFEYDSEEEEDDGDDVKNSDMFNWMKSKEWHGEYTDSFLQYLHWYYINSKEQFRQLLERPEDLKKLYKYYKEETKAAKKEYQTYTAAFKQIKRFLK